MVFPPSLPSSLPSSSPPAVPAPLSLPRISSSATGQLNSSAKERGERSKAGAATAANANNKTATTTNTAAAAPASTGNKKLEVEKNKSIKKNINSSKTNQNQTMNNTHVSHQISTAPANSMNGKVKFPSHSSTNDKQLLNSSNLLPHDGSSMLNPTPTAAIYECNENSLESSVSLNGGDGEEKKVENNHSSSNNSSNETKQMCVDPLSPLELDQRQHEFSEAEFESLRYKIFIHWMKSNGAKFPNLTLQRYEKNYRGVHIKTSSANSNAPAVTEISKGKIILKIPHRMLITVELAKSSVIGKLVSTLPNIGSQAILAVYLLQEKQKSYDSFWKPWFDVLPSSFRNLPMFFNSSELSWLKGSNELLLKIKSQQKSMKEEYNAIQKLNPPILFSYEEFVWSCLAVGTRVFSLCINGQKTSVLAPLADMMNHKNPSGTNWSFDNKKQSFILTACSALFDGDPVHESYGVKDNKRFFASYGFCLDENLANEVSICIKGELVIDSAAVRHFTVRGCYDNLAEELLAYLRIANAYEYQLKAILQQSENSAGEHNSRHFSQFAHAFASSLHHPGVSSSPLFRSLGGPLSVDNELSALYALRCACKDHLRMYETTLEDDLALLAEPEFSSNSENANLRNCLIFRIGEKKIYKFFIDWSSNAISLLCMPWEEAKIKIKQILEPNSIEASVQNGTINYISTVIAPLLQDRHHSAIYRKRFFNQRQTGEGQAMRFLNPIHSSSSAMNAIPVNSRANVGHYSMQYPLHYSPTLAGILIDNELAGFLGASTNSSSITNQFHHAAIAARIMMEQNDYEDENEGNERNEQSAENENDNDQEQDQNDGDGADHEDYTAGEYYNETEETDENADESHPIEENVGAVSDYGDYHDFSAVDEFELRRRIANMESAPESPEESDENDNENENENEAETETDGINYYPSNLIHSHGQNPAFPSGVSNRNSSAVDDSLSSNSNSDGDSSLSADSVCMSDGEFSSKNFSRKIISRNTEMQTQAQQQQLAKQQMQQIQAQQQQEYPEFQLYAKFAPAYEKTPERMNNNNINNNSDSNGIIDESPSVVNVSPMKTSAPLLPPLGKLSINNSPIQSQLQSNANSSPPPQSIRDRSTPSPRTVAQPSTFSRSPIKPLPPFAQLKKVSSASSQRTGESAASGTGSGLRLPQVNPMSPAKTQSNLPSNSGSFSHRLSSSSNSQSKSRSNSKSQLQTQTASAATAAAKSPDSARERKTSRVSSLNGVAAVNPTRNTIRPIKRSPTSLPQPQPHPPVDFVEFPSASVAS